MGSASIVPTAWNPHPIPISWRQSCTEVLEGPTWCRIPSGGQEFVASCPTGTVAPAQQLQVQAHDAAGVGHVQAHDLSGVRCQIRAKPADRHQVSEVRDPQDETWQSTRKDRPARRERMGICVMAGEDPTICPSWFLPKLTHQVLCDRDRTNSGLNSALKPDANVRPDFDSIYL